MISVTTFRRVSACVGGDSRYVSGMFELTRREQWLVAGFVFVFLLGLGVGHWREKIPPPPAVAPVGR